MANVIKHKRGSGSDPGASDLVVGEVAIRTDTGKLFTKMDNGSVAEIAGGGSDIAINTLSSSSGTGGGSATFNGSAYRFTLSAPPSVSAYQLLVSINGVVQKPVAGSGQPSEGFSVDGNDIILGDAPATGSDFFILTFKSLGVSEPADNSVTSAKIADGAIVNADINASAAIAGTKISPDFGSQGIATTANIASNADNSEFRCGTNADFKISHTGSENILRGDSPTVLRNAANNETLAKFTPNGAVELYHDNTKRFETGSLGVRFFGNLYADDNEKLLLGNSQDLQIYHDGSHSRIVDSGTGNLILQTSKLNINNADGSEALIHATENGKIELYHDNSVKFETTSTGATVIGSLGIGTTSPTRPLHITSDEDLSSFTGTTKGAFCISNNDYANGEYSAIDFTYTGSDNPIARIATKITSGGSYLSFGTSNNYSSGVTNEALTLDTSGNVGIGTSSPSYRLDLGDGTDGNDPANGYQFRINAYGDYIFALARRSVASFSIRNNATSVVHLNTQSSKRLSLGVSTGSNSGSIEEHLNIISGGNVGIGTASPAGILHLSSGASGDCELIIEADTDNNEENDNARIVFKQDGGSAQSSIGTQSNELVIANSVSSSGGILFKTGTTSPYSNATERMRIDSSGDVGIGTTSPSARLHVSRSNNNQTACIINNSGATGGNGLKVTSGGTGSGTKIFNVFRNNTASEEEVFTILGGGEVGIGTSSPSYPLDVRASSGDANMRLKTDGTGSGHDTIFRMQVAGTTQDNFIYFGDSDDSNAGYINYNHDNDYLRIFTNAGERLRINSEGIANIWGKGSSFSTQSNHHAISNNFNSWIAEMVNTVSGGYGLQVRVNSSSSGREGFNLYSDSASQSKASIMMHGGFLSRADDYAGYSDVKLKENIVDAKSQWDDVKAIKVRNFNWKDNPDQKLLGVVAQELETICPNLIHDIPDKETDKETGEIKEIGTVTKAAKYSILHMKAFKALQEAMAKIETLETKVAALEAK